MESQWFYASFTSHHQNTSQILPDDRLDFGELSSGSLGLRLYRKEENLRFSFGNSQQGFEGLPLFFFQATPRVRRREIHNLAKLISLMTGYDLSDEGELRRPSFRVREAGSGSIALRVADPGVKGLGCTAAHLDLNDGTLVLSKDERIVRMADRGNKKSLEWLPLYPMVQQEAHWFCALLSLCAEREMAIEEHRCLSHLSFSFGETSSRRRQAVSWLEVPRIARFFGEVTPLPEDWRRPRRSIAV